MTGSDCNLGELRAPEENRADPLDQATHTTERKLLIAKLEKPEAVTNLDEIKIPESRGSGG